jgi:hypothetical protein
MADEERELEKTNQSKFRKRKDVLIKTQNKNRCRKKIRDRDRDTHTERGVRDRSIDRSREENQSSTWRCMKTRAKLRLLPLQLLSGRIEPRKRNRAAQMRWRGKKEIQRWPWYIWGETERERRGVRGFRQHGKGPPVQPVTGKEGHPGRGGEEVDTYVPILAYDRYPIPKCSNTFLFFFFFSFLVVVIV